MIVGRFAPSPTGYLHHGSLVAALGSWLCAKKPGGKWLLRIDDLDTPRVIPGMADDIMGTLEQLGFEWDGVPLWQSRRGEAYADALERLDRNDHLYPCCCSRADIARIATAPHGEDEIVYPGTCSHGKDPSREARSIRVRVPSEEISFDDVVTGRVTQRLADCCGDFVVRRADDLFAYHLATVVDDADSLVNQVVRGADLITSTGRQIFLQTLLGYDRPSYVHLPLVIAPCGSKLSKRDSAVSIAAGINLELDGGILLTRALAFLGQDVSAVDQAAPPKEILSAALLSFDTELIPKCNSPFVGAL
ncbi:MAG: tRNA glutamyl-Q(34) synthetase GluQRS [Geobacteraceae bacterium]|nr:tRNA glutamyl-Q(34) synthetase GluQRS [Geobacteraceae bacterium]